MDLYKITFDSTRPNKKFYESTKAFENNWKKHVKKYTCYTLIAYKLDYKNECWREIIRVKARRN